MSIQFYLNEKDWEFKQAELAQQLERRRLIREAKEARKAQKLLQKQGGVQLTETKTNQKVGKETLGWN